MYFYKNRDKRVKKSKTSTIPSLYILKTLIKLVFHSFTRTTVKLASHAVVQVTCRLLRDTNPHQAWLLVPLTNAHAVKEEAFSCPGLSRLSDILGEVSMKRNSKTSFKVRAVNQGLDALIRQGRNHLKSGSCCIWKSWNRTERIFCQLVSHPQLVIHKGLEGELNPFFNRYSYFCDYHIDSMSCTLVLSRQEGSCMRGGKRENDKDEISANSYYGQGKQHWIPATITLQPCLNGPGGML